MFHKEASAVLEKAGATETGGGELALSGGLPVGFMRCTGEKYPKVLYASEGMLKLLGMGEEDEEWREMICGNLFFMTPFEDYHILRGCLEAAGDEPVSLEHRVIQRSGGQKLLSGWLRAAETEEGREYHFVYMPSPSGRGELRNSREEAYRRALENVYDLICLVDRKRNLLECVHQKEGLTIHDLRFAQITADSVTRLEVFQRICEEDRDQAVDFITRISRGGENAPAGEEGRILFRMTLGRQRVAYEAVAVELDPQTALLCCRQQGDAAYLETAHPERSGTALKRAGSPRVSIRTFGYFDVFVDGQPIAFRNEKSKELLAVLVDRQGSFVSNPYIINCLWEDEPYSEKIQSRCRQVAHRLMQTLKEYGVENIIERVDSKRRIVPELVRCDYFDYAQGVLQAERSFTGSYLSDYSWGEVTLSNLLKKAGAEADG